jgi:hypothetical protein
VQAESEILRQGEGKGDARSFDEFYEEDDEGEAQQRAEERRVVLLGCSEPIAGGSELGRGLSGR